MVKRVTPLPSNIEMVDNQGKQTIQGRQFLQLLSDRSLISGEGSPEGIVEAAAPAIYIDEIGASGSILYVKQTGSGNTGWVLA